jgi:hypothetical protein
MIQDQNKSRDDKGLLPFDAMQMCDFIIQDRQIKRLSGPMGNIRDNDVESTLRRTTIRRIKYPSDKRYNEEENAHVREEYQENEDGHRGYRKQYRNKHRPQPGKYYSQQDYDPNMRLYQRKWDKQWEQENNQYYYPARNRGRGRGRYDQHWEYHNNGRYENQEQNQQRWATPEMGQPRRARRPPRHYRTSNEPTMQKATRYVERINTQPWKESDPRMGRIQDRDKVHGEEEEDETDGVSNSDEEEEDEDEDAHEEEDDAWEDEEEEDEEYEVEAERQKPHHNRY